MTAALMYLLWAELFTCVALTLVAAAVRGTLYRRHERLMQDWATLCRTNQQLIGYPGPFDLENFPGIRENRADIQVSCRFMAVMTTATAALALGLFATVSASM